MQKEVVRRFGWSGGRWCRAEIAVVLGTESDQGKGSLFPIQVQKGYVHMALQNTSVRYNHLMTLGYSQCMS